LPTKADTLRNFSSEHQSIKGNTFSHRRQPDNMWKGTRTIA
jgi:hypothetical protein